MKELRRYIVPDAAKAATKSVNSRGRMNVWGMMWNSLARRPPGAMSLVCDCRNRDSGASFWATGKSDQSCRGFAAACPRSARSSSSLRTTRIELNYRSIHELACPRKDPNDAMINRVHLPDILSSPFRLCTRRSCGLALHGQCLIAFFVCGRITYDTKSVCFSGRASSPCPTRRAPRLTPRYFSQSTSKVLRSTAVPRHDV